VHSRGHAHKPCGYFAQPRASANSRHKPATLRETFSLTTGLPFRGQSNSMAENQETRRAHTKLPTVSNGV
jgi:hypothetical protein